jgi:hypothetical protein
VHSEISDNIQAKLAENIGGVTQLNFDKKNTQLRFDKNIKKKKPSWNTVLTPTRRQKPTHKSPTAAGMRKYNRSATLKKRHPR